ncbi:MAG TPA: hypothetical protein VHN39_05075 [Phenylobacterium sp.]|jgi:hypothetical protein|nr:hypothetical protein [Phenylobacterium sp.]
MKLAPVAIAIALALTGAAAAVAQSSQVPNDPGPGTNSAPTANDPAYARSQIADMASASQQFRLACAADRETFCKDRKSKDDVLECIKIRRSKLTGSCRAAWDNLVMASEGRL